MNLFPQATLRCVPRQLSRKIVRERSEKEYFSTVLKITGSGLAGRTMFGFLFLMATGVKWLCIMAVGFFVFRTAHAASEDRLLSAADLAGLDRDNAMWRLVQVDQEVEWNLQHWREHGFQRRRWHG